MIPEMSLDNLHSAHPEPVGKLLMTWLHAADHYPPEQTVAASAAMFYLLLNKYQLSIGNVMPVGEALVKRAWHYSPQIRAAARFAWFRL